MSCPNTIDEDSEAPCGDEGRMCSACADREAAYWARYFGLHPDMSRAERRAQLERWRPFLDPNAGT